MTVDSWQQAVLEVVERLVGPDQTAKVAAEWDEHVARGKVEVTFLSGPEAAAQRFEPSRAYAAEKEEFGATRRARWFAL